MKTIRGNWKIDVQREQIDVTSNMPRPDPEWAHTDSHGHVHRWEGERHYERLPTLVWVQDEANWIDMDGDEHNGEGHYECVQCGDHVTPGMRGPSPYREFIPGPLDAMMKGTRYFDNRTEEVEVHFTSEEQFTDLYRRVAQTSTPDIRDRIMAKFADDHPDQCHVTSAYG